MNKMSVTLDSESNRSFYVNGLRIHVGYVAEPSVKTAIILDKEVIPAIHKGLELVNAADDIDACLGAMLGALESCRDRSAIDAELYDGLAAYVKKCRKALR